MRQRAQARLSVAGRDVYLGRWPSKREADIARDRAVLHLELELPLRYPLEARSLGPAAPAKLIAEARALEKAGTTSNFLGVSWDERKQRWRVSLKAKGRVYGLNGFLTEESAAIARDRLALHLGPRAALNFPKRRLEPASFEQLQVELRERRTASQYRGVGFDPDVQRFHWAATITLETEGVFLGRFATEREAAIAYDRAARHYLGKRAKLNIPSEAACTQPADEETLRREARAAFKKQTKSQYRGVWPNGLNWQASITHRWEQHYLGTFGSEEEAAEAYDKAARRLHGARARLNFPVK